MHGKCVYSRVLPLHSQGTACNDRHLLSLIREGLLSVLLPGLDLGMFSSWFFWVLHDSLCKLYSKPVSFSGLSWKQQLLQCWCEWEGGRGRHRVRWSRAAVCCGLRAVCSWMAAAGSGGGRRHMDGCGGASRSAGRVASNGGEALGGRTSSARPARRGAVGAKPVARKQRPERGGVGKEGV